MKRRSSKLIEKDVLLKPFERKLRQRHEKVILRELEFTDGKAPLKNFCNNHLYYGLHKGEKSWIFREKAPHASAIYIFGTFSYWQIKSEYALHPIGNGDWEIELPLSFLKHCDLYKLWVVWQDGADERLPSHVRRVVQDGETKIFAAQVWNPSSPYQ